jgi:hypothetical protein
MGEESKKELAKAIDKELLESLVHWFIIDIAPVYDISVFHKNLPPLELLRIILEKLESFELS